MRKGREGGREEGKEGGRERGREGGREGKREGGREERGDSSPHVSVLPFHTRHNQGPKYH